MLIVAFTVIAARISAQTIYRTNNLVTDVPLKLKLKADLSSHPIRSARSARSPIISNIMFREGLGNFRILHIV